MSVLVLPMLSLPRFPRAILVARVDEGQAYNNERNTAND